VPRSPEVGPLAEVFQSCRPVGDGCVIYDSLDGQGWRWRIIAAGPVLSASLGESGIGLSNDLGDGVARLRLPFPGGAAGGHRGAAAPVGGRRGPHTLAITGLMSAAFHMVPFRCR